MTSWFKRLRGNAVKSRLLENFFSLTVLQATNYLLSFITLPYLTRVLGVEKYGLVMFAQAFTQYFMVITDYGFNLSGTRAIALVKDDRAALSRTYSAIVGVRVLLLLASLAVMLAVVFSFGKFRADWPLFVLFFGMVIGNVLFPTWFFQGVEQMRYITILNFVFKAIFVALIFLFVRQPSDYIYVPLFNALGFITAGLAAVGLVSRKFSVHFYRPTWWEIRTQLSDGWNAFISGISITLYTVSNTFLLGLATSDLVVGYYAAAEKIYRALVLVFTPFYQALYPHLVQLVQQSREKALRLLDDVLGFTLLAGGLAALAVGYFAGPLLALIVGGDFSESVGVLRIFAPLLLVVPLASVIFYLTMMPFQLDRYYSRIYLFGGLLNLAIVCIFLFVLNLAATGVALAGLLSECAITLIAYIVLRRNRIVLRPRLLGILRWTGISKPQS